MRAAPFPSPCSLFVSTLFFSHDFILQWDNSSILYDFQLFIVYFLTSREVLWHYCFNLHHWEKDEPHKQIAHKDAKYSHASRRYWHLTSEAIKCKHVTEWGTCAYLLNCVLIVFFQPHMRFNRSFNQQTSVFMPSLFSHAEFSMRSLKNRSAVLWLSQSLLSLSHWYLRVVRVTLWVVSAA